MSVFSVTEREVYKRCRRRWDYSSKNRQNLQPVIDAPALTLGIIVHKSLEQWFEHPHIALEKLFMANAYVALERIKENYKNAVGSNPAEKELVEVKQNIVLGISMMINYQEFYKTPLPEDFELVTQEQRAVVSVEGTEHQLEARVDAVIRRISDGAYFIMDHKTYEKRPNRNDLANNDQFLTYAWAASKALCKPISGYLYNGLWKREKPPRNLVLQDLFVRELVFRPEYEIQNVERQLAQELNEMGNPDLPIYPNRRWEGCWDCKGFSRLCEAQSKSPKTYELLKATTYTKREPDNELDWILDDNNRADS